MCREELQEPQAGLGKSWGAAGPGIWALAEGSGPWQVHTARIVVLLLQGRAKGRAELTAGLT